LPSSSLLLHFSLGTTKNVPEKLKVDIRLSSLVVSTATQRFNYHNSIANRYRYSKCVLTMKQNDRSSYFGEPGGGTKQTDTSSVAESRTTNPPAQRRSLPNNNQHSSRSSHYHNNVNHGDNTNPNVSSAAPTEHTMRCMTVVEEGSKIAFACYDEDKNEILVEESHIGRGGNDIETAVQSFLGLARPNLIVVSTRIAANVPLLELLTRFTPPLNGEQEAYTDVGADANANANVNVISGTIPYQLLKSKAFDLKNCKNLILNKLRVLTLIQKRPRPNGSEQRVFPNVQQQAQMPAQFGNRFGQYTSVQQEESVSASVPFSYHSIASIVNFDSNILLRVLGSLLCHLQGTIFRLEEGATVTVNTIQYATSSQYMRIDTATLHALHIFSTENHAFKSKGVGTNRKEGFSLFTLLDRTKSKVGKQCLKEWMLKPLLDPRAIQERQDGVALFLRTECSEIVSMLMNFLSKVGAVDKILLKMQKCHSVPMDFIVLSKTLQAANSIFTTLNGDLRNMMLQEFHLEQDSSQDDGPGGEESASRLIQRQIAILDSILSHGHVSVLQDLYERIISIVDREGTLESKETVVINYGFHEELDNAKELFDNLDGELLGIYFMLTDSLKASDHGTTISFTLW